MMPPSSATVLKIKSSDRSISHQPHSDCRLFTNQEHITLAYSLFKKHYRRRLAVPSLLGALLLLLVTGSQPAETEFRNLLDRLPGKTMPEGIFNTGGRYPLFRFGHRLFGPLIGRPAAALRIRAMTRGRRLAPPRPHCLTQP
jgi:hypothetical protein